MRSLVRVVRASLAPQSRHPDFSRVIHETRPFASLHAWALPGNMEFQNAAGERAKYWARLFRARPPKTFSARDHGHRPSAVASSCTEQQLRLRVDNDAVQEGAGR